MGCWASIAGVEYSDHGSHSLNIGCGSVQLVAPSEKEKQSVTPLTSQEDRSWLKSEAAVNMNVISETLEVSQALMFWSKADANANISTIDSTLEVSHPPMFWSKAVA